MKFSTTIAIATIIIITIRNSILNNYSLVLFDSEPRFGAKMSGKSELSKQPVINHSFTNVRYLEIQRENQRLLKAIWAIQKKRPISGKIQTPLPRPITPAELSRQISKQQIWDGNLALEKRLRLVKPIVKNSN